METPGRPADPPRPARPRPTTKINYRNGKPNRWIQAQGTYETHGAYEAQGTCEDSVHMQRQAQSRYFDGLSADPQRGLDLTVIVFSLAFVSTGAG